MDMKLAFAGLAGFAALAATAACTQAPAPAPSTPDTATVRAALMERYDKHTDMETRRVPAEERARFLFWPEAIDTGEGLPRSAVGLDEIIAQMKFDESSIGSACKHAFLDPLIASGDLALVTVQYSCPSGEGKPDLMIRASYAWQKRGDDWKIIRTQWGLGVLR